MFKKIIRLFFPIFLFIALISIKINAVDKYPLWVGGIQVTSENTSGKGWSYSGNAYSGTLTLTNANIKGSHTFEESGSFTEPTANIYVDKNNKFDLKIIVHGVNKLSKAGLGIKNDYYNFGENSTQKSLTTITGDGTLNIESSMMNIEVADLTIEGITLTTKGNVSRWCSIGSSTTIIKNSDITTDNAISPGKIAITDSVANIIGKERPGIDGPRNLNISGNSFVTVEGHGSLNKYGAIHVESIDLKDDLEILEPASSTINGGVVYYRDHPANRVIIGKKNNIIKFVNNDGKELQVSNVAYGKTPVYSGKTPTTSSDLTFAGWQPKIAPATRDTTYTATYAKKSWLSKLFGYESEGDPETVSPITVDNETTTENTGTSEALNAPKTGDKINYLLWVVLVAINFIGLLCTVDFNKKHTSAKKH